MGVFYLGIEISGLTYIVLLLFGLIIFVIIMILTEKQRQKQKKHRMVNKEENDKLKAFI
jgi:preprotein translocase subunit YajC